jgi:hypothetical protein
MYKSQRGNDRFSFVFFGVEKVKAFRQGLNLFKTPLLCFYMDDI